MLMKCEPIFLAVEQTWPEWKRDEPVDRAVVLLSAQGRKFGQATARRWSGLSEVFLICGRYEGVDERVAEHLASEEISVGDFVLSGGELGAAMIVDVVARLLPGVLGNEDSALQESFTEEGLLDCPQYTRRDPQMAAGGGGGQNRTDEAGFEARGVRALSPLRLPHHHFSAALGTGNARFQEVCLTDDVGLCCIGGGGVPR
jgi:hypothetical protein